MTSATLAICARVVAGVAAIGALAAAPTITSRISVASTGMDSVSLASFQVPTACGHVAEALAKHAENNGHPGRADRLDDRADRRADRQGCD